MKKRRKIKPVFFEYALFGDVGHFWASCKNFDLEIDLKKSKKERKDEKKESEK